MESLTSVPEVYEPLDTSKIETRILRLQPAAFLDDVVFVQLNKGSLKDAPVYDAISYVWGDPKDTVDIQVRSANSVPVHRGNTVCPSTVDEHWVEMPITISLAGALRRLRDQAEVRILWTDALCVNQLDLQERAWQVKMMGQIFASASVVHVLTVGRRNRTGSARGQNCRKMGLSEAWL
jgi:hypothetical protein